MKISHEYRGKIKNYFFMEDLVICAEDQEIHSEGRRLLDYPIICIPEYNPIGHFRVALEINTKARLSAKLFM